MEELFEHILQESDETYKAKVNGKWLSGNKLVKDKKDADTFESKTEPTQRINQMKKDGKLNKNAKPTIITEGTLETIKTPFGKMLVVDEIVIQDDDKVTFCQKAREKFNELDKDGWFPLGKHEPYWYAFPYNRAKFTLCVSKRLGKTCFIDYRKEGEDKLFEGIGDYKGHMLLTAAALGVGALSVADRNKVDSIANELGIELSETEYGSHKAAGLIRPIYEYKYDMKGPMNIDSLCKYLKNNTHFDEITYEDDGDQYIIKYVDNYKTQQKVGNGQVTKHRSSSGKFNLPKSYFDVAFILEENKTAFFDYLLEAVEDFPKNTRAMYRFAKRRHDDTGAIRKVSKQPYWVHPEGVAKIVMEHGGSDVEIKAAMAHDVLEDTGESYEDMVEKFGDKVASIVKEVTNDKDEIAKVGKEKYISEELCRLSPEALTVKLADMLYNMKDSPTEKNYERMRKNIAFLMMNRQLDGKHLELAQEIMEV